ncbi:MAG: tRNA dihydrouridine synthase DusB [Elusimicrobia bacterium]|nr:tRNA dihydrouridine synthase DusB [Elusimicrobiota bacterium]MDE2236704.1 tRNA dihydrouridine synthase DusB [Elusimicrobiota bacterium]MDE2424300.1 tRNA dihydrouridine synthase DusB [Elusimicrobiota bacterium]
MLALGELKLPSAIIQSPMAACTDLPFRLIAREKGLAFSFLEMVSAQALVRDNEKTKRLLATAPLDRPLGAQLLGCEPAVMAEAARIIEGLGFDLLDLNLGCPVRKVTGNGEGSALLKEPDKAEKIFAAVRRAVRIPVTVKTRKGFEDPSGAQAVELARRAQAQGLCAVTVHGRTQAQLYSGRADYEAIGKVKAAVGIPVVGNGDVAGAEDALRLKRISGCDGVMIGRAGLGNPWIYRNLDRALEGKPAAHVPGAAERRDTLLRHFELELEHQGARHAALNMRRIVVWYTAGLPQNKPLRAQVCRTMDVCLIRRLIEDYFASLPEALPPPQAPLLLAE